MPDVSVTRTPPNWDRISVLAATILLGYTFAGFISFQVGELAAQLPGIYLEIEINMQTIVSFLAACLGASGADWLLREHPKSENQSLGPHLLLPALTAWVIGIPLYQRAFGFYWWVGIFLGGGALILVLIAEFTVVDPDDTNYSLAAVGLTIVAYALFFLLAVTLKAATFRLFLLVPALTLVLFFVNLRILHLRLFGKWALWEAGVSALIMAQISVAAYYLPFSPISFGLFLLGPAYALTSVLGSLKEGATWKAVLPEPVVMIAIFWFIATWFR